MKRMTIAIVAVLVLSGCDVGTQSSDQRQSAMQETLLQEATRQTGMPAIKNFRERKILKDILELRDQEGLTTWTYIFVPMTGELKFLGQTIGYGIPYATQYTNPLKMESQWVKDKGSKTSVFERSLVSGIIPQADPTGLFSPESAEGTWVLMKNPNGEDVVPIYVEPRIVVSPFPLHEG